LYLYSEENINQKIFREEVILSDSFSIDLTLSKVIWQGKALGIIKHMGTVNFSSAILNITDNRVKSGHFIVDLKSIKVTDKKLDPKTDSKYEKLKQHLSSAEFFDVDNYPEAFFTLDSILGNKAFGDLKIQDNSHKELVDNIIVTKMGDKIVITGELAVSRKSYNVSWDSSFRNGIVADEIKLKVVLVGE
jgi:polyisoprenoid-binding protein YceI